MGFGYSIRRRNVTDGIAVGSGMARSGRARFGYSIRRRNVTDGIAVRFGMAWFGWVGFGAAWRGLATPSVAEMRRVGFRCKVGFGRATPSVAEMWRMGL